RQTRMHHSEGQRRYGGWGNRLEASWPTRKTRLLSRDPRLPPKLGLSGCQEPINNLFASYSLLQFGLMYFNSGAPSLGVWNRDFFDSLEQAVLADRVGFNSVLVSEHHFTEQGYTTSRNIVCGMLAARTGKVRIGPGVALLPLHHPVALAEEAALLDRMSNGRCIMGVGLGYRREEFEGYNISLKEGSSRLEEG